MAMDNRSMKSKIKKCNSCHSPNTTGPFRIKNGNCYSCRKKVHHPIIHDEAPRWRLTLILNIAALTFISIAAQSLHNQHIVLPYNKNRSRVVWYEFNGMEVITPVLAIILLSVGLLAAAIAHYSKQPYSKTLKRTIIFSLCAGWFLYLISIFFGNKTI
jgi:hypothetical protein